MQTYIFINAIFLRRQFDRFFKAHNFSLKLSVVSTIYWLFCKYYFLGRALIYIIQVFGFGFVYGSKYIRGANLYSFLSRKFEYIKI